MIEAAARDLGSALQKWSTVHGNTKSLAATQEQAAAQIASGNLDAADRTLTTLEQSKSGPLAATQNLRAIWLVESAQSKPPDEAKPLLSLAKDHFSKAAQAGETDAWLNLALLLSEQNELAQARNAAQQFVGRIPDPERREIVRQAFGL